MNKQLPFPFVPKPTIGDGSCFLHAILQSCSVQYLALNTEDRIKMVRKLRHDLSQALDDTDIYDNLSRGELKEISESVPEMKKENMKRFLNSNSWITYHFVEMISTLFNINIYVVNTNKTLYNLGDDEIMYNKNRNSVFIRYHENVHFETLGVDTPDGVKTFFDKKSDISKFMNDNYIKGNYV